MAKIGDVQELTVDNPDIMDGESGSGISCRFPVKVQLTLISAPSL